MGMNMMDMIMQAAGGQAPQQIGQQFGLNQQQSQSAISALLPAISTALKQNTNNPQGLAGLLGALQNGSHDQYLENPAQLGQLMTALGTYMNLFQPLEACLIILNLVYGVMHITWVLMSPTVSMPLTVIT